MSDLITIPTTFRFTIEYLNSDGSVQEGTIEADSPDFVNEYCEFLRGKSVAHQVVEVIDGARTVIDIFIP